MKRDLVTIDDLSNDEIKELFALADVFVSDLRGQSRVAAGFVIGTLFYEPSTRTRLSFEVAIRRLGGSSVTEASKHDSSQVKGESLADTIKVVGSYVDLVVIRHPVEGAARLASRMTRVPVINAGDGGHEHPTQTLCDLYTLWKEKGRIEGLSVALCGDLKHGRTVHSLAYALARFGADIISVPAPGLEMPDYVLDKLQRGFGCHPERIASPPTRSFLGDLDAVYITPQKSHQLSLFTDPPAADAAILPKLNKIDALYVTRAQRERFDAGDAAAVRGLVVNKELLQDKRLRDTVVMHPLPRVDEISSEIDSDPRAVYFRQAERGVPIRMALLSNLLGLRSVSSRTSAGHLRGDTVHYANPSGISCPNPRCITRVEPRFAPPDFQVGTGPPIELKCEYCERVILPDFVADLEDEGYLAADDAAAGAIPPERLEVFTNEEAARASGRSRSGRT